MHFFAYDWRLSNQLSAEKLDEFIEENNYTDVVLVCHSMGGLVASGYLAMGESQRNKTETVIMLGAPLLGTPEIAYAWGTMDLENFGVNIDIPDYATNLISTLRSLLASFVSAYELFPSEWYFDEEYANQSYINEIDSYTDTQTFLVDRMAKYRSSFVAQAELFHNFLYDSGNNHITNTVNTYYIAGKDLETTEKLICTGMFWFSMPLDAPQTGDEVVPVLSASLGDIYGDRTFFAKGIKHSDLVTNNKVLLFINDLIAGDNDVSYYDNIEENVD